MNNKFTIDQLSKSEHFYNKAESFTTFISIYYSSNKIFLKSQIT